MTSPASILSGAFSSPVATSPASPGLRPRSCAHPSRSPPPASLVATKQVTPVGWRSVCSWECGSASCLACSIYFARARGHPVSSIGLCDCWQGRVRASFFSLSLSDYFPSSGLIVASAGSLNLYRDGVAGAGGHSSPF